MTRFFEVSGSDGTAPAGRWWRERQARWRARIVLLSADGLGTHAIMLEAGVSKTVVLRWQGRFAQEGVDGLLRDKTRPARIPPLGPEVAARVVALTQGDPPGETTHWTAAAMSKVAAISVSARSRT